MESQQNLTNPEIISLLQSLVWANKETRSSLQASGVNILPVSFYSNTPSIREIDESFEYHEGALPYLNSQLFDPVRFESVLKKIMPFSAEFAPTDDDNPESPKGFFWNNGQYGFSDAMSYYCFVRALQPKTVLEIGSGFSTLIGLQALEKNGVGSMRCIEPYPREFLKQDRRVNLEMITAQQVTPEYLNDTLVDGDILFIDSTHTVKSGSDCLHIYLRLIPQLKRTVYIHVHDVFLPFAMPKSWLVDQHLYWTEQYLLMAFLLDNPKALTLFGSCYNTHQMLEPMNQFMHNRVKAGGGSFWFLYRGNPDSSISTLA